MFRFGFIVRADDYDSSTHRAVVESPSCRTQVVGAGTIEIACDVARQMADDGVQLIELCGDFGPDGARVIIEAVEGRVPVGYVTYFPEEEEKTKALGL